jgi:hypothetical protein
LEHGYTLEQVSWDIESLINLFEQGWTANLLVLAMLQMKEAING